MRYIYEFNYLNGFFSDVSRHVIRFFRAVTVTILLAGCGGSGDSPQALTPMPAVASSVQRNSPRLNTITQENRAGVTAASLIPALPQSGADQLEEVRQLARLKALPILSILSDRERAGLLKQLRNASPSERLASINQYPRLASISEQQKQAVLNEIEKAVPVNISASQLICSCSNDIKREMCVRERCSNLSEMQSLCNQACGTLAAFKSECSASSKCAGK